MGGRSRSREMLVKLVGMRELTKRLMMIRTIWEAAVSITKVLEDTHQNSPESNHLSRPSHYR
jgi:hypothetical protein